MARPRLYADELLWRAMAERIVAGLCAGPSAAAQAVAVDLLSPSDARALAEARGKSDRELSPKAARNRDMARARVEASRRRLLRGYKPRQAELEREARRKQRSRATEHFLVSPAVLLHGGTTPLLLRDSLPDPRQLGMEAEARKLAEALEDLAEQARLVALALKSHGWGESEAMRRDLVAWAKTRLSRRSWPPFTATDKTAPE